MKKIKPNKERLSQIVEVDERIFIKHEFHEYIRHQGKEKYQRLTEWFQHKGLSEYSDDLLYLVLWLYGALQAVELKKLDEKMGLEFQQGRDEYIQAIKLIESSQALIDHEKLKGIRITIDQKAYLEKVTITSPYHVWKILTYITNELSYHSDIQINKPKGRPPKHKHIGRIAHLFQLYLQKNTPMKAEKGISISNQQADFILGIMGIMGWIDNKSEAYDIGYIRKYLAHHRKTFQNTGRKKSP